VSRAGSGLVRPRRGIRMPAGDAVYRLVAGLTVLLFVLAVLVPFLNFIAVSLSGKEAVVGGRARLWPVDVTFEGYEYVFRARLFFTAMKNSVVITVLGSTIGTALTLGAAYPLSKPRLPGRKAILLSYVFAMLFHVGIIPHYLLVRSLGLLNSRWALILPLLVDVFNLLVVKSYFENVPPEIEESAKMDGASPLRILSSILLPIAVPVVAAIFLFYAVGYWNNYFLARFYITSHKLMPVQLYLQIVIFNAMDPAGAFTLELGNIDIDVQTLINATVVVAMLPIVVLYPFVQRYFTQGIIVGSVKG
jgi:putative aldouronate transport system permease protein